MNKKIIVLLLAIAIVTVTLGCTSNTQSKVEETAKPDTTADTQPQSQVKETENNTPLEAQKYYNEGFTLYNQGKYLEALEQFDKASEIDPNFVDAWYNKGVTLSTLGRYPEAIQSYDRVIAIDPNHTKAWWNKGVALNKIGRYAESQECFNKSKELDPSLENIET